MGYLSGRNISTGDNNIDIGNQVAQRIPQRALKGSGIGSDRCKAAKGLPSNCHAPAEAN